MSMWAGRLISAAVRPLQAPRLSWRAAASGGASGGARALHVARGGLWADAPKAPKGPKDGGATSPPGKRKAAEESLAVGHFTNGMMHSALNVF